MSEVFLNGTFVGDVDSGSEFAAKAREERRKQGLHQTVSIRYDPQMDRIYVESSRGRCMRPLIVSNAGIPSLTDKHIKQLQRGEITWSGLIEQGVVEWVDAAEEENALTAFFEKELSPEHTHLEISPFAILGPTSALVPYGNYILSARLSIGSKGQKQSIGFYAANFPLRMDMDVNLMHYPQVPIVHTAMHDVTGYEKHPAGQNIIVAVMSYKGYNIEDAVILNKGSVERGLGRSTHYRPVISEELRYSGGLMDQISIPDKDTKGYRAEKDYRFLEGDGIIYPEARVKEEDVIVGKTSPPRFLSSLDEYSLAGNILRESSSWLKHGEEGTIDFVLVTESEEGNKLVQVRIRNSRKPEIGDKFTSRHAQKGVVGMIVPERDLPFTSCGVVPDLIFSPHSIPSRMTVSHLLELVGGKVGALSGRYIDATAFESEPEENIRKELLSLGFKEDGTETLYNGLTGEQYQAKIFIGNMYYMKLKHMVSDKIHARARGPIQLLTRQPTEGRAKEGGLRLGEMEKDTFVAHGASLLLKERFDSDKAVIPVCESCGLIAVHDMFKDRKYCLVCGENVEVSDVEVSYAFKLMLDEFKSLCIYPKLVLRTKY